MNPINPLNYYPQPRWGRGGVKLILIVVLLILAGTGGVVLWRALIPVRTAVASVLLEGVNQPSTNPFMPKIGADQPNVTAPPGTGGSFSGSTPGLYGGTRNIATCDPQQMVAYLAANPDKAAAWASVLGITPADIPSYVSELTPMILRSDTVVTNHGFQNGRPTTLSSVLQAGTAVLVDKFGTPATKCYCGNPLTPPRRTSSATYSGTPWPSFSSAAITQVQPSAAPIQNFTIIDRATQHHRRTTHHHNHGIAAVYATDDPGAGFAE
jgi:uncharacterized protein DUF6777